MRHNPHHATEDPAVVRRLIRENPWGILVSNNNGELVASHYPVLLDEEAEGLTVLTHVGRPDEMIHGFGDREILLIIEERNGYISPSYEPEWTWSDHVKPIAGTDSCQAPHVGYVLSGRQIVLMDDCTQP